MSWVGHVADMSFGEIRREFWWGKPERMNRKCECEDNINPLSPELNPICYLLALLGAHHFLHVSRIRVRLLTFR